jgi:phosphohistidine phosphatase
MKTLLILRHAKSSWKHEDLTDHERPLNKRGKKDAPKMGRLVAAQRLRPDLIVSSTAQRSRVTAEEVAAACGYEGEVELTRDFYHAAPNEYLRVLREVLDTSKCVMVVGHNPGLEDLLARLTGEFEMFPTGGLAQVALAIRRWRDLELDRQGKLVNLWRPREVE